jgi:hypothetical protein
MVYVCSDFSGVSANSERFVIALIRLDFSRLLLSINVIDLHVD